jgi:Na+-transporting NADH:ubiquinone oxidoreductase subunit NqrC
MKKVVIWIVALLCVAVVCGGFYLVKIRSEQNQSKDKTELTEVQRIITKDIETNYPATPREVVKYFNRILAAIYCKEPAYSEEELSQMADKILALFDEELLAENPKDTYLASLKADIADYQERSRYITSTNVCESDEVQYVQDGEDSLAYVQTSYFIREGSNFTKPYEQYVLRKDGDGNWKILTFYQVEGDSSDDDE